MFCKLSSTQENYFSPPKAHFWCFSLILLISTFIDREIYCDGHINASNIEQNQVDFIKLTRTGFCDFLELWIELKREGDFPNHIRGGRNCSMLVVSKAWRLETGASHFIMIHQLESTALAKRTHRLSWPSNTPTKISSAQITNTRYVHHTLARMTHWRPIGPRHGLGQHLLLQLLWLPTFA